MQTMITDEQIAARATGWGGFKKSVLADWGVPWPPPRGWRRALVLHGFPYQPLSDSERKQFEVERRENREGFYQLWLDEQTLAAVTQGRYDSED